MRSLALMKASVAVVAAIWILNAQGTWAAAPSQAGFVSIDCGVTAAYVDPNTGINWVPDGNFTSVGTNVQNVPGSSQFTNSTDLSTLRYFNEAHSKYCYVLPGLTPNASYLIRSSWWYGNYDRANKLPTFRVSVDSTELLPVNLTSYGSNYLQYAYIYKAQGDSISFCLFRDTTLADPFISSLELRPFVKGAYEEDWLVNGNFLFQVQRRNYGGTADIRYPDDEYDRIWQAWEEPSPITSITATGPVTDPNGYYLKPPPSVMETAQTLATVGELDFPMNAALGSVTISCVLLLYFAELNVTSTVTSRTFTINIQGYSPFLLNIYNSSDGALHPAIYIYNNFTLSATSTIALIPTATSIAPPLLNAAELYAHYPVGVPPTFNTDVAALEAVKLALNLSSWGGDPCLPISYDWVTCSSDSPPRVLSVKLSNYNLTGAIPIDFAKLTALTTLWLDNNQLTGSIPDLSSLSNLATLHLQDNELSGSIPATLGTIATLKELFLQNNNLTGDVPPSLNRTGLLLNISGNPACKGCSTPISPASSPTGSSSKKSNVGLIAGVVGGVVAAVVLIGCLVVFFLLRKRSASKRKGDKLSELPTRDQHIYGTSTANGSRSSDGSVSNQSAKAYTLGEVTAATNNFSKKIGEGGFGPVYYGKMANGQEVAVKVSDVNSRQGVQEFNNEVQLLSRVHHKNLVSLLGYFQDTSRQMLIYEYLHRGTVRDHLYGSPMAVQEPLDWRMRLDIALNAAQGLEYLHAGCSPNIIHRDIKSSNILLADNFVAKVADFGLSKLAPEGATHVSTVVKGTAGYLDPEYWSSNALTEKSDVYSFGVVLLEIICGRVPIDSSLPDRSQWSINDRVRNCLQAGDIDSILDPAIARQHPNMDSVWKVAEVAIQSVEPKSIHRPYMRDIVRELREAIALETGYSGTYSIDHSNNGSEQLGPRSTPPPSNFANDANPAISTFSSLNIENNMRPQVR